jgi:hypothetical protein
MKFVTVLTLLLSVSSIQSLKIECFFRMHSFGVNSEYVYSCDGRLVSDDNPGVITEIVRNHRFGFTDDSVEAFFLYLAELNSIPQNISDFFPNVKAFDFGSNEIVAISASDLQPFPELVYFSVAGNRIVSLDSDLFIHNSKLVTINFGDNHLQIVGANLLGHLIGLTTADFRGNPCIDVVASSPEEITDLNLELPVSCTSLNQTPEVPSTTSETPESCTVRCSLDDEVDELRTDVTKIVNNVYTQGGAIGRLTNQVADLVSINESLTQRISVLEELAAAGAKM